MKKIASFTITTLIILLASAPGTFALAPFEARDTIPGYTVEIKIPKGSIKSIEGDFEGEEILFFEISERAKFDDSISRADFLELMFANHEFEEPETEETFAFLDVPEDNPHHETVMKAAAMGLVNGYDDGLFRPDTTITRGQIAKILVEAFDPERTLEYTKMGFADLPSDHVFYSHMNRAIQAELFKGYPDGLMRPDREINVSEAEIVVQRAAQPEEFTDLGEIEYFRGLVGINRTITPGTKILTLDIDKGEGGLERENIEINVGARTYHTKTFSLPESTYNLFGDELLDATWTIINEAKSDPITEQLWEGEFIIPTKGRVTLGFGDKLNINGTYVGSHFGYDYADIEGTLIWAPANGKVTYAGDTASYGYIVVLDHGQNVFTMYLHLSETLVEKGQYIDKGETIGLMGDTGLAIGSHLHYTQFVGNVVVDTAQWEKEIF